MAASHITMATDEAISCTVKELDAILKKGGVSIQLPVNQIDEVYDNVYVGGESSAKDKKRLQELGVTHILNCAHGPKFFCVNTNKDFYEDVKMKYCGLPVSDFPQSNIKKHFDTAVQFIDEGLSQENGKVLVHCVQGFSRSATVAIAYLMIRRGISAQDATKMVRGRREIGPNSGFLKQLCALNDELHKT